MDDLRNISPYDSFLNSVDAVNMTALHVLSCNPNSTLDMIRELASKCPDAAFVKTTKIFSYPVDFYLLTKNIVKLCSDGHVQLNYELRDKIKCWLMRNDTGYTIYDLIKSGLRYDHELWDILLAFQGKSMKKELSKRNDVTGLYPFMTAAVSKKRTWERKASDDRKKTNYKLGLIYKLAMVDPTLIVEGKKRALSVELSKEAEIGNYKLKRGRT